ncbi:MAG: pilus assembly protein TadG-related protein [Vicinamibacterales bacterium]
MRVAPLVRRSSLAGRSAGERGAILVQTAAMLVGLTALSAFVVDYGILWTARRQIQNTADAAAMAAALSLAFYAPGDLARARANAYTAVNANKVWGQAASMEDNDVSFAACPSGSVGRGACVRVQVYRNEDHQSPLPTIFGSLVGVNEQGVRATATAQVLYGDSADCVKPVAVPDRWTELFNNQGPAGWDPLDTFQRYQNNGRLIPGGDLYVPPAGVGNNGSGYTRDTAGVVAGSYGVQARFEPQRQLNQPAGDRQFIPVRISPGANGPMDMLQDFADCSSRVISPGMDLEVEPANATMPTREGVAALVDADLNAYWDPALNGGRGGVAGGCMATGGCTVSPRIVPLVAFDPDEWDQDRVDSSGHGHHGHGRSEVTVTRLLGFFVESYEAPYMVGRFMGYPAAPRTAMTSDPQSSFIISVALVR